MKSSDHGADDTECSSQLVTHPLTHSITLSLPRLHSNLSVLPLPAHSLLRPFHSITRAWQRLDTNRNVTAKAHLPIVSLIAFILSCSCCSHSLCVISSHVVASLVAAVCLCAQLV